MSDNIKLVIEIPKKVFEARKIGEISPWVTVPILDAVQNGTPLDDVKAEIEQLRLHKSRFITSDGRVCIDSQDVLEVLDNIGKAESEE